MESKYLYSEGNKHWFEYKGKKYYVIDLPISSKEEQHRINKQFIDSEVMVENYWRIENEKRI